mmetsp:Transcript_2646/g.4860  ORF Transcript_2646/g.4860 Transcript_2646/m.4860 type:complete len:90 (-) Transcript_2646:424-693(-)
MLHVTHEGSLVERRDCKKGRFPGTRRLLPTASVYSPGASKQIKDSSVSPATRMATRSKSKLMVVIFPWILSISATQHTSDEPCLIVAVR